MRLRSPASFAPVALSCAAAVSLFWLACSSSSSTSAGGSAPFGPQTYTSADQTGSISRITFVDSSSYTLTRWSCSVRDTGCTESGTYTRDESARTITFTRTDGGTFYQMTLPLGSLAAGPATADEVASSPQGAGDDDDDDAGASGLTPQDLTGGTDGGLLASTGTLTVGTPVVQSFSLDGHTFASAALVPVPDGGASLVTPLAGNWLPTVRDQQGQLITDGGGTISPTVVTITWSADPNAATWEQFIDALAPSAYWTATSSEYGVGAMTVGPHVRLTTAPPTNLTSEGMGTWINTQISASKSAWPAPAAGTYYALFLPPVTSSHLREEGESGCDLFDGEHDSESYKGTPYAYAIMLQCPSGNSGSKSGAPTSIVDEVTSTAAHELVEGAADPWQNRPAYLGFDAAHLAWDLLQNFQDEVADACEDFPSIDAQITSGATTYAAQRIWSNAAASAGHDPCVPAPAGAYFTIYPEGMTTVSVKTPKDYAPPNPRTSVGATLKGLGFKVKVGSSMVIPLQLVSDVAGTGPWTLAATEGSPEEFGGPTSSSLSLSLDKSSGSAGDVVNLTVQVKKANTKLGGELVTIASTMNGVTHWAPILISN